MPRCSTSNESSCLIWSLSPGGTSEERADGSCSGACEGSDNAFLIAATASCCNTSAAPRFLSGNREIFTPSAQSGIAQSRSTSICCGPPGVSTRTTSSAGASIEDRLIRAICLLRAISTIRHNERIPIEKRPSLSLTASIGGAESTRDTGTRTDKLDDIG